MVVAVASVVAAAVVVVVVVAAAAADDAAVDYTVMSVLESGFSHSSIPVVLKHALCCRSLTVVVRDLHLTTED